MKKTISIIGSTGIPARYGGFETLAEQLAIRLVPHFNIYVACSKRYYQKTEQQNVWMGVNRIFSNLNSNGISSVLYDLVCILKIIWKTDCILLLGSSAAFFVPFLRILNPKIKILFHPDGIEWKRTKWNLLARTYLYSSSFIGTRFAQKVILDNIALANIYSRVKQKIKIISYGGDQYSTTNINSAKKKYWLTIARAEPENNLDIIADCFQKFEKEEWILISNWPSTKYGVNLHKKYSTHKNIRFIKADYKSDTIGNYLNECKGYIHGHGSGGTNPSLVAALWRKIPILCHRNIYNTATTQNLAQYFGNSDELLKLLDNPNQSNTRLFELSSELYTWEIITKQYFQVINEL